jgi:Tfp pilus assembly protein PilF
MRRILRAGIWMGLAQAPRADSRRAADLLEAAIPLDPESATAYASREVAYNEAAPRGLQCTSTTRLNRRSL